MDISGFCPDIADLVDINSGFLYREVRSGNAQFDIAVLVGIFLLLMRRSRFGIRFLRVMLIWRFRGFCSGF